MLEKSSDDDDNVGVIIVAKRDGRGMPGSIEKPPCHIWIQRTMRRRRSGSRGGGGSPYLLSMLPISLIQYAPSPLCSARPSLLSPLFLL